MKKMIIKYEECNNKYLCYIKGTKQAYWINDKVEAENFTNKVNEDIESGKLYFVGNNLKRK